MARPKRTTIKGQKHELAYINKDEKRLLRSRGGGVTKNGGQLRGPGDIPAYYQASPDATGHGPATFGGVSGQASAQGGAFSGLGAAGIPGGISGFSAGTGSGSVPGGTSGPAGAGGAPTQQTLLRIRQQQDINPIPKGDLSGTNQSSESTETVEQPLSSADEAEARRRARSGFGGSGILERTPIGLTG